MHNTSPEFSATELSDSVTCGKFFPAESGMLYLSGGRMRFESGERCIFDTPVSSIEKLTWHWYSFSAAFEARIGPQSYFFSFIPRQPSLNQWYGGLTAGRPWRAALEGRPVPAHGPLAARLFLALMTLAVAFLSGCFILLGLSVALDETQSRSDRILSCLAVAGGGVTGVLWAIQGTRRVIHMFGAKRGPGR